MNFPKKLMLALCLVALPAHADTVGAQKAPETRPVFAVSAAATMRIATALDMTNTTSARNDIGRRTEKKPKEKDPTAVIAFGITLLAAPVSMGGAFSR